MTEEQKEAWGTAPRAGRCPQRPAPRERPRPRAQVDIAGLIRSYTVMLQGWPSTPVWCTLQSVALYKIRLSHINKIAGIMKPLAEMITSDLKSLASFYSKMRMPTNEVRSCIRSCQVGLARNLKYQPRAQEVVVYQLVLQYQR